MEDLKEQISIFNELENFGVEILTRLQNNFEELEKNCTQANDELKNAENKISKLAEENENLRRALAEVNLKNQQLSAALIQSQKDFQKIKNDFENLRDKLSRVRNVLAGGI